LKGSLKQVFFQFNLIIYKLIAIMFAPMAVTITNIVGTNSWVAFFSLTYWIYWSNSLRYRMELFFGSCIIYQHTEGRIIQMRW